MQIVILLMAQVCVILSVFLALIGPCLLKEDFSSCYNELSDGISVLRLRPDCPNRGECTLSRISRATYS